MSAADVVVYGAGGHAKIVLATLELFEDYRVVGLLDDDTWKHGQVSSGYVVLGGSEQIQLLRAQGIGHAIVAIGDNNRRIHIASRLQVAGYTLIQLVHPAATVLRGARIGAGTVVLPYAFVGADAVVGENAIISVGAMVGHDCRVGSGAQLCPKASLGGGATVGAKAFVGMAAVILPLVSIGSDAKVGAGSTVIHDLPDGVTAVGLPARTVK